MTGDYPTVMDNPPQNTVELGRTISRVPQLPAAARARTARALIDEAKRLLSAEADAAVVELTRSMSYADAAQVLGISVPAVNKAVSRHRRAAGPLRTTD